MPSRERKEEYFERMEELLDSYRKILVVSADHVGSQQFHMIRKALRGTGVVLMGKNTMMRKVIANFLRKNEDHPIENLIPYVKVDSQHIHTNPNLNPSVVFVNATYRATLGLSSRMKTWGWCDR